MDTHAHGQNPAEGGSRRHLAAVPDRVTALEARNIGLQAQVAANQRVIEENRKAIAALQRQCESVQRILAAAVQQAIPEQPPAHVAAALTSPRRNGLQVVELTEDKFGILDCSEPPLAEDDLPGWWARAKRRGGAA